MKKNVLYIIHSWLDLSKHKRTTIGGTSLHAYDIIKKSLDKYNYFVLSVMEDEYILTAYIGKKSNVYNTGVKCKTKLFDKYDENYKKLLFKIVEKLNINIIHIHHLLGHSFDILTVMQKYNRLTKIITIHDYFFVCPQINLLYKSCKLCEEERNVCCKECINKEFDLKTRKKIVKEILSLADDIIIPNSSIKEEMDKTYKGLKYTVIEHGIDMQRYKKKISDIDIKKKRIAFIGVRDETKGSLLIRKIIHKMKKTQMHVFGSTNEIKLKTSFYNYTYHGEYRREEITKLLTKNQINLVCLLSIWPETYCYTLSETIYSGIPVLGIDLGAIGERVRRQNIGWLIPANSTVDTIIRKYRGNL